MARPAIDALVASATSAHGLVLAAGRPADAVAFEEQVVEFFVGAADILGVPKSVAAIYGVVFASPTPLNFADIEARLNISKGSVSQGLRVLREVGALKEVSRTEDRRELFEPDLEMRKLIERFLEKRMQRQLDDGKNRLTTLRRRLPSGSREEIARLNARLKSLQSWQDKARALMPVVRTFLKLT